MTKICVNCNENEVTFDSNMHRYLGQNNGNIICSLDKVEIQLFEVRISGVGLYITS